MLRTIVVPVDFSEPSKAALSYARALAPHLGARVHALHVCDPPWIRSPAYAPPPSSSLSAIVSSAAKRLWLALGEGRTEPEAQGIVRAGEPCEEILRYSREMAADLVVMGTHGSHGAERQRLGRTARHVLHSADCPVLTLRALEAERS